MQIDPKVGLTGNLFSIYSILSRNVFPFQTAIFFYLSPFPVNNAYVKNQRSSDLILYSSEGTKTKSAKERFGKRFTNQL